MRTARHSGAGRRRALKAGGALAVYALALAAGLVRPARAQAQPGWNKAAFETKTLGEAGKALGAASMAESREVRFLAPTPEISENGGAVPIAIASTLPGTRSISILVAKNPNVLAATFELPEGTDAFVSTRIKMSESSDVVALVKLADGRFFYAKRPISVTLGGCGA